MDAQDKLQRLDRLLTALAGCNPVFTSVLDEKALLLQVCQALAVEELYYAVWAGLLGTGAESGETFSVQAGKSRIKPFTLLADADDPLSTAVREGHAVTAQNISTDGSAETAHLSCMAIPFLFHAQAFGALVLYSATADAFDEIESKLLNNFGFFLSQGLNHLRHVEKQDKTTRDLEQQRALLTQRVEKSSGELSRMHAEIARGTRLKDEFLASMSHELRTPLNSILNLSEALEEEVFGPLTKKQRHYVNTIERSGRHLLSLINDILDLSKIEAGKLALVHDETVLSEICEAALLSVKDLAQQKKILLDFSCDERLRTLYADPVRLKQILMNLLNNAVKFTPEGGNVRFDVKWEEQNNLVSFHIKDTGIGISSDNLQKLFQPFTQIDSSLARRFEGTGLGLTLVERLTELHGGSIQVESVVDKGSCFSVFLPHLPPESLKNEAATAVAEESGENNRGHILLVEDNVVTAEILSDYLKMKGFQVHLAWNGVQGVEQAEKLCPDIILMDMQMPVMDGLEATRRIRAGVKSKDIPIIALTALAMPEDNDNCFAAGVNRYLSKPVQMKSLMENITGLLAGKR